MRAKLARDSAFDPPKALILGPKTYAQEIAKQLESESFKVFLERDVGFELPRLSEPDSLQALRKVFNENAGHLAQLGVHFIHPGLSSWAERPELALVAEEMGFTLISPPARLVSFFSNKLTLIAEADRLGIPHLVIGFDPVQSAREVRKLLEPSENSSGGKESTTQGPRHISFVLKSIRGRSGSSGIKVIHRIDDLERELGLWLQQLRLRFGEPLFFVEKYLEGARQIVVPFCRFDDERIQYFPFVDISLQSHYRTFVEFCPASAIDAPMSRELMKLSTSLLESCNYVGMGYLEFLVDGPRVFLVDGGVHLDSGFPLWQKVAGTQAVSWQLATLENKRNRVIPALAPEPQTKAAVGLHLYAEDSLLQIPQPGIIFEEIPKRQWKKTHQQGDLLMEFEPREEVRIDSEGVLGLVRATAAKPSDAYSMAREILEEVWISGSVQTNEQFLRELLDHPWVREGVFHAGFIEEDFIPNLTPPFELFQAAAEICHQVAGESSQLPWIVGRTRISPSSQPKWNWITPPRPFVHEGVPGIAGQIHFEGRPELQDLRVCAFPLKKDEDGSMRWRIRLGSWVLTAQKPTPLKIVSIGQKQFKLSSLVPGRIHSILYMDGSEVPAHQPVVMIESLQTLVPHSFPISVKLGNWKVKAEDPVTLSETLVDFEKLT